MSLALMRVMHVPRSRCRSIRPTRMTQKVWRRSCARDGTVKSFEAHHARALLAARSQLVGPRPLYRGFKSMTFWHGFASLPCSIPDGNGYRPRFKPVSVGSIRQYISQLLLARTNRGMCGCASGLARQSPDRQQSIDRTAGWRGSPAVRAHRSSKPWCGNASRNSRNVTCHGSSGRSIDHQDPDHDARSEGTGGVPRSTTRAGELLNGRYAGLGRPVNTCSLSMCASAKEIPATRTGLVKNILPKSADLLAPANRALDWQSQVGLASGSLSSDLAQRVSARRNSLTVTTSAC